MGIRDKYMSFLLNMARSRRLSLRDYRYFGGIASSISIGSEPHLAVSSRRSAAIDKKPKNYYRRV
jgi:hypothetical protein